MCTTRFVILRSHCACNEADVISQLPEHLKSYYKIWLDYRNEENSVEQYKAACDQIKRLLVPCVSSMPHIPVYPCATLSNELRPGPTHGSSGSHDPQTSESHAAVPPSSSTSTSEDWNVGILLGQISMHRTSVQFPYFEPGPSTSHGGGSRTAAKRKHRAPETVTFASPVLAAMSPQDSGGAPEASNRKIRTCKRCKQRNCEGIFLSRPCKVRPRTIMQTRAYLPEYLCSAHAAKEEEVTTVPRFKQAK